MYICIDRDLVIGDLDICNFAKKSWDPKTDTTVISLSPGTRLYDRVEKRLYCTTEETRLIQAISDRNFKHDNVTSDSTIGIFMFDNIKSGNQKLYINMGLIIGASVVFKSFENLKDITYTSSGTLNIDRSPILRSCITFNKVYKDRFKDFPDIDTLLKVYHGRDSTTAYSLIDKYIG